MNRPSIRGVAAALAAAVVLALPVAVPSAQAQPAAGGDMMSMMRDNNEKMMSMKPTGDPDVDFAMMMRMHHMGGMQMAEHEIKNGRNDEMKKMARKIRDTQKKEVEQFDRFLARKGQPGSKK